MIVRSLASFVSGRAWRRFEATCQAPEATQADLWKKTRALLLAGSFWRGRLAERLPDMPITTYADYVEVLARDATGTVSSLNGERITFWAESSGTTGRPKLFPITPTYRAQFQTVNLPFVQGMIRRFPNFLRTKVLYFTSPGPTATTPSGVGIGFISGFNYLHTPRLLARAYALPREVLRDGPSQARWASVYAAAADVGAILAVTPARIRLMAEDIWTRRDEILDLLSGRHDGEFRAAKMPLPQMTKDRRAHLANALMASRLDLGTLWPSLAVVGAWRTSACALQLASLEPFLPAHVPRVDVIYSATEGWVNVPFETERTGGPIHPGGMICELAEVDDSGGLRCVPLSQVVPGRDYEILLTNTMGLVRYRLFDVVRCTGFFHRSPIIEFVGKAARELVIGMIRVSETQLVSALSKTSLASHPALVFAPRDGGDGLVLWYRSDIGAEVATHVPELDRHLMDDNRYYRRDVSSGLFRPLEARALSATHPIWERLRGGAQTKPRLYVDEPLA